ncbi:uncharacterized protein BCR38DRAFT_485459 [Pseudomassariella vexata]|uniref:Uncharacterized protein n=1 Tax=Pseudomassariella vexata TaxID=1141098 RepID=A0A1Y2DYB5_9PEZI|nr:uncharacterized protein BCR38DRAFT_485459 [Pseudomassariella vexata]ORY64300.1 hypothetical protein BCR38DRAFT_485459 [Pseudomassariella vexata]
MSVSYPPSYHSVYSEEVDQSASTNYSTASYDHQSSGSLSQTTGITDSFEKTDHEHDMSGPAKPPNDRPVAGRPRVCYRAEGSQRGNPHQKTTNIGTSTETAGEYELEDLGDVNKNTASSPRVRVANTAGNVVQTVGDAIGVISRGVEETISSAAGYHGPGKRAGRIIGMVGAHIETGLGLIANDIREK